MSAAVLTMTVLHILHAGSSWNALHAGSSWNALHAGATSGLARTMAHALARWVTYHAASAVGLGAAAVVLGGLFVLPRLLRIGGATPARRRRR